MNSLKAKVIKIAKTTAIFGILASGFVFASGISFQNVPIINSNGQPVVQIVVGSQAKISDGIVAGNIAAMIGNLAYASQEKSITIYPQSFSCNVITSPNAEVYLNETQTIQQSTSAYTFSSVIGAVLNGAVLQNNYQAEKSLQTTYPYAFSEANGQSPYTNIGYQGTPIIPSSSGGLSFQSFTQNGYDNLVKISLPSINSNENQAVYISGFPVYNQQANQLQLEQSNLVYQVQFQTPLKVNSEFNFLGDNYTIMSINPQKSIQVARYSSTDIIYVGKNITIGNFTIEVGDLGQPNSQGVSSADVIIYYDNKLTNNTIIYPNETQTFTINGNSLIVKVDSTFAGIYSYAKYAKITAYADVMNFTNGKSFMNDSRYNIEIYFNQNGTISSIEIYGNNNNYQNLGIGSSLEIPSTNPLYKLSFLGQSLNSNDYDNLQLSLNTQSLSYIDPLNSSIVLKISSVLLNVSSSQNNAFSFLGTQSSNFAYDFDTYYLVAHATNSSSLNSSSNTKIVFSPQTSANITITQSNPLIMTITGYNPQNTLISDTAIINKTIISGTNAILSNFDIYKLKSVEMNEPILADIMIYAGNGYPIGDLYYSGKSLLYKQNSNSNYTFANPNTTIQYETYGNLYLNNQTFNFVENLNPIPSLTDSFQIPIKTNFNSIQNFATSFANFSAVNYISTQNVLVNAKNGFTSEKGTILTSFTPQAINFQVAKQLDLLNFALTSSTQSISPSTKQFGPYGIGMATNIPNVTIANVIVPQSNCIITPNSISENITTEAIYPLNTAKTPLVVLDTNANTSMPEIVIGSKFVNSVAKQIFAENPSLDNSFNTNSVIVQAFGNKILVAGYTANETIEAGNEFIEDLLAEASS